MKYLKTYEISFNKVYWQVSLRPPYFNYALKEIGMSDSRIKGWSSIKDKYSNSDKQIFMLYNKNTDSWNWMDLDYQPNDAKFMGKIDELYFNLKKYNI